MGIRPNVSSLRGMATAAHPLAALAGARILRDGGNAFDAAVAVAAALNVVEPFMSGLAGMGMATCYVAAQKRVRTLDFVTRVPSRFEPAARCRADLVRGPHSIGIPGNLAGWCALLGELGTMTRAEVFAPAIEFAAGGFPLTNGHQRMTKDAAAELQANDEWARVYADSPDTRSPGLSASRRGRVLRQPELARTYETIVAEGPGYLYGGALGRDLVDHVQKRGGCLTLGDLQAFEPSWLEPQSAPYRDLVIHTLPPPCEGFQFLLSLRILDGLDLGRMAPDGVDHLDAAYRAIRLAAEQRIQNNNAAPAVIADVLSDRSVDELRRRAGLHEPVFGRVEQWGDGTPEPGHEHTTSFSVADAAGNMVCITQSLGSVYGSGLVVPGYGVCLNNFLNWGDLNTGSPNHLAPGAALALPLAPSIATREGQPVLALGTPGSYGICQTQTQVLVKHVDFVLPIQAAIEAPRGRLMNGARVVVESRIEDDTLAALRQRGHEITTAEPYTWFVGGAQAISREPASGVLEGGADPRRDGYAVTP